MKNPVTKIRSVGVSKINQLVRAAGKLKELQPAFAEWSAGEVYVCKKTGDYRYRFGELGKSVTPWNAIARQVFASPAALAFAAMVLGDEQAVITKALAPVPVESRESRANVISMATGKAA